MSKVNTEMGGGKWFHTKSGVRQGCILSSLLFILYTLYMDLVIKEVHGINEELEKCMTTVEPLLYDHHQNQIGVVVKEGWSSTRGLTIL